MFFQFGGVLFLPIRKDPIFANPEGSYFCQPERSLFWQSGGVLFRQSGEVLYSLTRKGPRNIIFFIYNERGSRDPKA